MESGSTVPVPRRYGPETAVSRALAPWSLAQPSPSPEDTALRLLSPEHSHHGVWLNRLRPPEDTALRPLSPEHSHHGVWLNRLRPQKIRP
ncbi:hypothetical protein NDU88_007305 [Pleurodeles waltl]|uniref:Uncharacterized protein n=1 Tax=Pleurodeles waltl TaxID=8319 RepID=A0AAV7MMK6_PLEWA|nr:hypothetical protein NDU88_007305 [Pleurodeles waltl]